MLLDLTHLGAKKIKTRLPGSRELALDYAGVDRIDEPIPVRPGAHYQMGGVDADVDGETLAARPVRRRRGRLRLGARRQPPRRQLAHGDRSPSAAAPGRHAAPRMPSRTATAALVPEAAVRDEDRRIRAIFAPLGGERPWRGARRARRDDVRQGRHLPHRGAAAECLETVARAARARSARASVDDKGDRFNTDLTSVLELEAMLEMADCLVTGGARARRSPAARTRASTTPSATTSAGCGTPSPGTTRGEVRLDYKPVTITQYQPRSGATEGAPTDGGHAQDPALARRRRAAPLETYTVEVPETATLLDALDAVKDKHDGTLAYRKCCRMAVCGSCGMRIDGGAVLACKTADEAVRRRRARAARSRRWATCR